MNSVLTYVSAHGGFFAVFLIAVGCYNVVLSAIAQICAKLSIQEPVVLQKMGAVGLKISQWLSANTPTPAPAAAPAQSQPAQTQTPPSA